MPDVRAGKIENETFNTLKNQGYNFEHNYGHGYQYLSTVLALLMFLAFTVDQIQQHCYELFQKLWQALGTKAKLWECLRSFFKTLVFRSMEALFKRIAISFDVQLEYIPNRELLMVSYFVPSPLAHNDTTKLLKSTKNNNDLLFIRTAFINLVRI